MNETETLMTWSDVLADPSLQDLPYKIELSEEGKVVMSPAGKRHAILQGSIAISLAGLRQGGQVLTEIAVAVKPEPKVIVADVAWMSDERLAKCPEDGALPIAPEVCVEIKSPSNTTREMAEKPRLYFEAGAQEVSIVTLDGNRTIHKA